METINLSVSAGFPPCSAAARYLAQSVQPDLVGLHLLLGGLVSLELSEDVAGVAVRLILRHFKLLLHPEKQLLRISLEILQWQTPGSRTTHSSLLILTDRDETSIFDD